MKYYNIKLSEKDLETIRTALCEYAEICYDQGTMGSDKYGFHIEKIDKSTSSYKLAKKMDKVFKKLAKVRGGL